MTVKSVPDGVRRWSWGAFFLTWIWGIGNGVWISLLALIPVVNIVMMFVLGAKGNELAWKARHWESEDSFLNIQKKWAIVGLIIWIVGFLLLVILLSSGVFIKQYDDYKYASDATTVVENFQEIITQAEAAIAAAGAGQTTPLSMPHKLPEGANIMISSLSIDPNTSSVTVILKPSTKSSINNVTAQSLRRYGMVGCGDSGGCTVNISSSGATQYSHYEPDENSQYEGSTQQVMTTPSKDITEKVSHGAFFHHFRSKEGYNSVGSPAEGQLLIEHHGKWLVSTVNNYPVSKGYDFGSNLGNGIYQLYGEVSYKMRNYYIFRNTASSGQIEITKWQVAWRNNSGKFSASSLFGSGAYNSNIKTLGNKIIFHMPGNSRNEGTINTYIFTMTQEQ